MIRQNKLLVGVLTVSAISVFISCASLFAQYTKAQKDQEGEDDASQERKEETENSQSKPAEVKNKICPVDFKNLYLLDDTSQGAYSSSVQAPQKNVQYTYEGKTYGFDSSACVEKFKKDPQRYLKEWEKKERFRRINVMND